MSIYTDYVDNNLDTIDRKTFLKVCAWGSKELKKFIPEEIVPIEKDFDKTEELTALETKRNECEEVYNSLKDISSDEKEVLRNDKYDSDVELHYSEISKIENKMKIYSDLLANLCRIPTREDQPELRELKLFAINELTRNMPNLSKHVTIPEKPSVADYYKKVFKDATDARDKAAKQYQNLFIEVDTAKEYIEKVLLDIDSLDDVEEEEETFKVNI